MLLPKRSVKIENLVYVCLVGCILLGPTRLSPLCSYHDIGRGPSTLLLHLQHVEEDTELYAPMQAKRKKATLEDTTRHYYTPDLPSG